MSGQFERALQIAVRFRALKVKVIIGGSHVSVAAKGGLEHFDSVVTGEVEDILGEHCPE